MSFSRENPSPAQKYRVPGTPKEKKIISRRSSKRSKVEKACLPPNWVDLMGADVGERFSKEEIKRQEVCVCVCVRACMHVCEVVHTFVRVCVCV